MSRTLLSVACVAMSSLLFAAETPKFDYRVLAATRTSTIEKELNEAAAAGYRFSGVMGGESAVGGKEVLVVMAKKVNEPSADTRQYRLLAASKTSTLQKEMQRAGEEGFDYCGQTVFESAFGGKEVSVILERSSGANANRRIEYKLVATTKTSTMQKELQEVGEAGYEFLGVTLGQTAFGGKEVVSILRRYVP